MEKFKQRTIIEWVDDPRTGERPTVEIKLNEEFVFPLHFDDLPKSILVTKNLYNEVLRFVTEDKNIQYEQFLDSLIFKMKMSTNQ
ncbi:hypothetical protein LXJ15735_27870 [Lacrimispora xylanolytica]